MLFEKWTWRSETLPDSRIAWPEGSSVFGFLVWCGVIKFIITPTESNKGRGVLEILGFCNSLSVRKRSKTRKIKLYDKYLILKTLWLSLTTRESIKSNIYRCISFPMVSTPFKYWRAYIFIHHNRIYHYPFVYRNTHTCPNYEISNTPLRQVVNRAPLKQHRTDESTSRKHDEGGWFPINF